MTKMSWLAAASLIALSAAGVARAQEAPPSGTPSQASTSTSRTENQPANNVEEIVVTARQREESLKDVPIAVSAITGDTIKQQQLNSVRDVAAYVPGLNINSDSVGRAFISIRGIGTTLIDTVQPGVGIFIDGVYQPNTSYLNSPLVDVQRVEVLRGPQGTLFGNNTLGGAINVITQQPNNQFHVRADGAYAGEDDYRSGSLSVSGPIIPDLLQARIGYAYHQQDGFEYDTNTGARTNPLVQQTVSGTFRFLPTDWAHFTLNLNHDRVRGGNTPYVQVTGPEDYRLGSPVNQTSLATINFDGADLKGEFDAAAIRTKITAVAAYNRRDIKSSNDGDYGPVDFLRTSGGGHLITQTGELRFDTTWTDNISTLFGVFANRFSNLQDSFTRIIPLGVGSPAVADTTQDSQAVYGNVFWKIQPTLDLAVGLRYDHQRLNASNATTAGVYDVDHVEPRISLTKRWAPDFMTYASVAEGVRNGGQNGPGAPNLIYNGDSVWTYELGTKFAVLNRRLSVDAALFYNDYDDFIGQNSLAPSTTGAGFVAINLNTGHVDSYGAEAEAHWRVTDNLRIDAGLTLLHARITDDSEYFRTTGFHVSTDRVIFTPDWNFNLGANYTVPLGPNALVFDGVLLGKGSRPGSSLDPNVAPILASYYLLNGSIAYRMDNGVEVAVFATNLNDAKYIESYIDRSALVKAGLAPLASDLAIPGDRRRIGVRVSYRY